MSAEIDDSKAPLLDHLIELRRRLVYAFVGLALASVIGWFVAGPTYEFLIEPLREAHAEYRAEKIAEREALIAAGGVLDENECEIESDFKPVYISVFEPFMTKLKLAIAVGFVIAFPFIAGQIWAFVAPGLYRHEKKAFLPFLAATPVLFLAGASLVYYIVMPLAWRFLIGIGSEFCGELNQLIGGYLSLVIQMILAFGISFQLPILLMLLARVGMVSAAGLKKFRRYAIVAIFAFAAFVTPPDFISQIILGVPLLLLYELALIGVRIVEKDRAAKTEDA